MTVRGAVTVSSSAGSGASEVVSGLALQPDTAHVYYCEVAGRDAARACLPLLDESEREAARLRRSARDRCDYVVAHALLRAVLSRYSARDPRAWVFEVDRAGKPHLAQASGAPLLQFSLTHARGLVACAVSPVEAVGVDAERIEGWDDAALAQRFFAPEECRSLAGLPPLARRRRFFELWTLKEAYLKALGVGLRQPLAEFALTGDGRAGFQLLSRAAPDAAAARWSFALLHPAPDQVLSAACRRGGEAPVRFQFRNGAPLLFDACARITAQAVAQAAARAVTRREERT